MSNLFIEPVKLADKYKLTNLTDPSIIPQLIKGPAQSVVEQIEGDVTKYIQTTLVSLNIDQDILERQTAEIYRLNKLLRDIRNDTIDEFARRLKYENRQTMSTTVKYSFEEFVDKIAEELKQWEEVNSDEN